MPSPNASSFVSDTVHYQLIAQAPPPYAADIDSSEAAIELVILWGEHSILHVEHLSPPRAYCVGDASDARGKRTTDFLIGSETLGTAQLPIVAMLGERPAIAIAPAADGDIAIDDQVLSFAELRAQGQLLAADAACDMQLYPLPFGASARMHVRGFTFVVKRTVAARRLGVGQSEQRRGELAWTAASLLLHASLLVAFQLLPPRSSALSLDLLNADSRLVAYLTEPLENVDESQPSWLREHSADAEGGSGQPDRAERGEMGKEDSPETDKKFGVQKQRNDVPPQLSRDDAARAAKNAGIIGVLRALPAVWNTPTSAFGRDTAMGQDPDNALGKLLGESVGANHGIGGLSPHGTGRGGGGDGRGTIGVGAIGTVGRGSGSGSGTGAGSGYGSMAGRYRTHAAKVPQIRSPGATVVGSLSKETIRRVIGRHINEVRFCYEQRLNARPDLQGRVTTQFIIKPDGAVQTAAISGSDLADAQVEQCIARATLRWAFPAPEGGGAVVVTYPFVLSQSGD